MALRVRLFYPFQRTVWERGAAGLFVLSNFQQGNGFNLQVFGVGEDALRGDSADNEQFGGVVSARYDAYQFQGDFVAGARHTKA